MMLCEEHCRQISCVEETFQSSEIEAIAMEINKLKNCDNSSELKENRTDITVIKTITDKYKGDLTEYFSSLKNDINIHVSQKFNELNWVIAVNQYLRQKLTAKLLNNSRM
jgi:hypothetical protein